MAETFHARSHSLTHHVDIFLTTWRTSRVDALAHRHLAQHTMHTPCNTDAVVAMIAHASCIQGHPFKVQNVGSLTYADRPQCPGVLEPQPEQLLPVDPRFKFLMIIGAQKAGTTWLFDALDTHPLFSGAQHGYRSALPQLLAVSCQSMNSPAWLIT